MSDTEQRVKEFLADMTREDLWADVLTIAANVNLSEREVGEVIAGLQTGERAEPGDTIVTTLDEDGDEFYQYEPADGEPQELDA